MAFSRQRQCSTATSLSILYGAGQESESDRHWLPFTVLLVSLELGNKHAKNCIIVIETQVPVHCAAAAAAAASDNFHEDLTCYRKRRRRNQDCQMSLPNLLPQARIRSQSRWSARVKMNQKTREDAVSSGRIQSALRRMFITLTYLCALFRYTKPQPEGWGV